MSRERKIACFQVFSRIRMKKFSFPKNIVFYEIRCYVRPAGKYCTQHSRCDRLLSAEGRIRLWRKKGAVFDAKFGAPSAHQGSNLGPSP